MSLPTLAATPGMPGPLDPQAAPATSPDDGVPANAAESTTRGSDPMPATLPPFLPMVRRALPRLLEGTIAPVLLFYLGYLIGGLLGGLIASLAWAYGAVAVRLLRGQRVTGLLALSLVALTGRSLAALGTGSVFFYFLQPTLGTFLTAGVFLVSAATKRPLTRRLSADLVDLPEHITAHPGMDRLHVTLSVLWGATFAVSGALALWLLVSQSLGTFLVVKFAASGGLMVVAIAASTMMFLRFVRGQHEQPASVAV